jgi:hypothetical protein
MATPGLPYMSHNVRCYYKNESTFGSFNASGECYSLPWTDIDPAIDPNLIKLRGAGTKQLTAIKRGMRQGHVRLGWILPSDPTVLLSGCYDGTARSIEVIYYLGSWSSPSNVISLLFTGCRANRFSVAARASPEDSDEAFIRAEAEFICQNLTVATAKQSTGTYNDTYTSGHRLFTDSYVLRDGAEMSDVIAWKVDFNMNLKPIPVIRTTDAYLMKYLQIRQIDVEAELELAFTSKTRYDEVLSDTARDWEIGLGATGHKILLDDAKQELVSTPLKIGDVILCRVKLIPLTGSVVRP